MRAFPQIGLIYQFVDPGCLGAPLGCTSAHSQIIASVTTYQPFRRGNAAKLDDLSASVWRRDKSGRMLATKRAAPPDRGDAASRGRLSYWSATVRMWMVTFTGWDGMPFATTSSVLSPVSASVGTWNQVETILSPVATPDVQL